MSRILIVAASCFLLATPCSANNSYFIPGDAFFYCEIDQSEWKALQSGELSILDYDRPEEMSFSLCGYAGYKRLDLSNLSDKFRAQLIKAIASMKEKYPTKIVEIDHGEPKFFGDPAGIERKETNKLRIFIYNSSFDFSQFRIGLKYNESWAETAVRLGFKRDHFRYDFFVPTPQGIAESWRMGSAVSPLKVQLPDSDRGYVTAPMKIEPSKVTFLVCPPVSLNSLCFPPLESKLECSAVSENWQKTLINDTNKTRKSIWVESK
ncbi:hypothetical protein Pan97_00700 [Bremerella volcania]|uniref:Uncharacterized protein n=1 Tax=Bremerella volcania TaxID=2527984 RepID=A0A518C1L2_9BACT|nr:hypothetical protein [Bremerella volcania]QDU73103.1 hypothetical protein Pan97_00700 [Bremerella volcania]